MIRMAYSLLLLCACSSEREPDLFESRPLNTMPGAPTRIVATGADDLWMQLHAPPTSPPIFGHTEGYEQWARISFGNPGQVLGMAAFDRRKLWVLGTGPMILSSVERDGLVVVDRTPELAGSVAASGDASIMAGHGGMFVATRDSSDALHVVRYVDDTFVELEHTPSAREVRILAVVGPDEAYIQMSAATPGQYVIQHYNAGTWAQVRESTTTFKPKLVARSRTDVWIWGPEFFQQGEHCNGETCTEFEIQDWPRSNPNAPGIITTFALIPAADNELALVSATPLTLDHGTGSIVSIRINASGEVLSTTRLFGCDHHGCEFGELDAVALPGGSVVIVDDPVWHVGTIEQL